MSTATIAHSPTDTCIANTLLAEFEQELKTTRRFIEQLQDQQLNWRPHQKSMTAGQLALHIAQIPAGLLSMTLNDHFQAADIPGEPTTPNTTQSILETLEESATFVRQTLPSITNERMTQHFKLMMNDTPILDAPRAAFLRSAMFNHLYHHRGQLGVYLRLLGQTVPSSYGPSGDENPFM